MKTLNSLFVAAAAAVALSGVSQAQPVSTTGQANPSPITVSGNIAKYVNFTKVDTDINLGNLGGALAGAQGTTPVWSPRVGMPTGSYGGSLDDSAEITWDSNTHLRLDISDFSDLKTTDANGIVDTIPTGFVQYLKGKEVKSPNFPQTAVLTTNNTFYSWGVSGRGPLSYIYGHGPASGINLGLYMWRSGLDDHAGTYTTSATMTWSDLG